MTDPLIEIEELLFDWEDGALDEVGIDRLRHLLRTDAGCRDRYAQFFALSGLLSRSVDLSDETVGVSTNRAALGSQAVSASTGRYGKLLLAATTALGLLLTGRWIYLEFAESGAAIGPQNVIANTEQETRAHGVAVLTNALDAVWGGKHTALRPGDAIPSGPLVMKSGYAQIEFFCGATVILEGPAELDLQSATRALVHEGRLRAQVPPAARGFTLQLDDLTVVDLGTEFGLSVTDEGTDVQVFDGEVELHESGSEPRLLTAGNAIRRDAAGYRESTAEAGSYLNIEALASRTSDKVNEQYKRWRAWSERTRKDPRLILYYAFDQGDEWHRRLISDVEPANNELDGAIVGAQQTSGRWPGKNALEFRRPGDRVRVNVPGEWESLTMCCWVRIDSLDRWFNSLFLTDSYNLGEPHWQILDTGQLYFSVRPKELGAKGPADYKALSPPFWDASLSGRWIHLATVYDMERQSIIHFLNGDVLSRHRVPPQKLAVTRIGTASIGNWALPTKPEAGFAVRNLNGSIDEFAVYSAALSAEEIRNIYEQGAP